MFCRTTREAISFLDTVRCDLHACLHLIALLSPPPVSRTIGVRCIACMIPLEGELITGLLSYLTEMSLDLGFGSYSLRHRLARSTMIWKMFNFKI